MTFASPQPNQLHPLQKQLCDCLLKLKIPLTIKTLYVEGTLDALAVRARLSLRGIVTDTYCPMYGSSQETIFHILFHCRVARDMWAR
ncbi:hypothetical protein IGI04_021431 [Brassica rapa subsp. trilocularis]|uniref:Reverse transcriptase zinc-binding domain-containing protein n=1 Tax=Brassica rapa subsp. trilocularis TaxID=1813537 RepID=A0ABQ7M0H0_BRACM|nr:hypothetical protein IGI04_021431 [Brassica rapa subsp. trilocularis]